MVKHAKERTQRLHEHLCKASPLAATAFCEPVVVQGNCFLLNAHEQQYDRY